MPYQHQLTDEERARSDSLAKRWRWFGRAAAALGWATGVPAVGHAVQAGASNIANEEQRKADRGHEQRLTPEEQERVNQYYDAHPSAW